MNTVAGQTQSVSERGILPTDPFNSSYLVDKPSGASSGDVVRSIKRALGGVKTGHAGTLDPFATGLLICLTGKDTRRSREFLEMPKRYSGVMLLGSTTASLDPETPILKRLPYRHIEIADVRHAADRLTGQLIQQTPKYSAVKFGGERLYRKARRGEAVPAIPRVVDVHSFEILTLEGGHCSFRLECSVGTYVRSLAGEIGDILGCGAHLLSLTRSGIGAHKVDSAWPLDQLLLQLETQVAGA